MSTKNASLTLLLLIACATYAAAQGSPNAAPSDDGGNPSAGLDEACKKTPDPDFCQMLLEPSAAIFAGNDAKKKGFAAVNATLGQVEATRAFMVGEVEKNKTSKGLPGAMMMCVGRISRSQASLNMVLREFDTTADGGQGRVNHQVDPSKLMIKAVSELKACVETLNRCGEAGKPAGEGDGEADVAQGALRKANDSVLACSVAQTFIS